MSPEGADVSAAGGLAFLSTHMLGRTLWTLSLVTYAISLAFMLVGSLWITWRSLEQTRLTSRLALTVLPVIAVGVPTAVLLIWTNEWTGFFFDIERPFFEKLDALEAKHGFPDSTRTRWLVENWVDGINVLLIPSLASFLGAFAFALRLPKGSDVPPAALIRVRRYIVALLYLGAAALVLGVVETHFLWRLPLAMMSEPGNGSAEALARVATNLTTISGVTFALFLMGAYAAATTVLTLRIRDLAVEATRNEEGTSVDDWLERHGFSTTSLQHFTRVTAAISPFVAGPLLQAVGAVLAVGSGT